jgi:PAS domain S-box-containing protein
MNNVQNQQIKLLAVLTILLFAWLISSWFIADSIMDARARKTIHDETAALHLQLENITKSIDSNLKYLHGVPSLVAKNDKVLAALSRFDSPSARERLPYEQQKKAWAEDSSLLLLNEYLDQVRSSLRIDIVWITNAAGICIASSNVKAPSSFVATDYSDREYFREAQNGHLGQQYAMGRKTDIPGLYFSAPVTIHGRFAGVAVAKIDLSALSHWVNQGDAFISDRYGVIIAARDKTLEGQSLPDATLSGLSGEELLARYKRKVFPPLTVSYWKREHFPSVYLVNGGQNPLLMDKMPLPEDDIEVHAFSRLADLDNYDGDRFNIFLLLGMTGIVFLLATGSRIIINRIRKRVEFQKAESAAQQLEIDRRIESEKLLADSHNLLRTIINTSPMRVFWKDTELHYLGCNPAFAADAGFEHPDDLIGKDDYQMRWQAQAELYRADDRQVISSGLARISYDEPQTTPDGRQYWLRTSKVPLRNDSGEIIGILGIYEDITDRKKAEDERLEMERQLLHAQKLESLGVLSGGIAHDFNNLLHSLLGNLDLALIKLPADATACKNIEQAIIAGKKAAKLTSMMLAYSGKGVFIIHELNLTALVEENAAILSAAISKSITFKMELDRNLPLIMADSGQIQQVVMNLITNAYEAIGDNAGSITLSTGVRDFDQTTLNASRLESKLTAGCYVWMQVSDTGCGMDDATLQRLFDPFFTTKFTGRGLGMSAVLGIINAHNGAFLVETAPKAGTTIRVLFPVADRQASDQAGSEPVPVAADSEIVRQTGMILIVDDEEIIREITVAMLESLGFTALTASSGVEALEIYRHHRENICMVILDQSMPDMDGVTTFKGLMKIDPEIKVMLASGYSEVEIAERYHGLGLAGFIQKPYGLSSLTAETLRVMKGVQAVAGQAGGILQG